jgi:methylglutaconyl-CoA hydratase
MLVTTSVSSRGIATVTLNRPDKHNALDGETLKQLRAALLEVQANPAARVVVLTGAGTSFCAGADIAHMRSMLGASEQANIEDARVLAACLRTLDELALPVIARINGNVFGGGIGLVACAGIVPAAISPYVVAAIGTREARRLFLTSASFHGLEARSLGLVHFACAEAELDSLVAQQAELVLQGGPAALCAAKHLIRDVGIHQDRDSLGEQTARLLASLRISPEGQEGLSAFLERRKAHWIKS